MPVPLLKGKVLKILDPFRVVVNIGYENGIKNNMKFVIYELGERIFDPDTGLIIDQLEIIKHKIKVTQIQEKFSIMKSDEYEPDIFKTVLMSGDFQSKTIPLSTDEKPSKSSEKEYKKIKIGDLVRQDVS
jgi:hypothetical protein